jgi:hypothetical protein
VVIDDFDIGCSSIRPNETNPPAIIDPDAVLSGAIAPQRFQTIAWWNPQILKHTRLIEHTQLSQCDRLHIDRQFATASASPDQSGFRISKTVDHG